LINTHLEKVKTWLCHSGIQNVEEDQAGGVNAWYDLARKEYPYIYSEITGYAITTFLFLDKLFPDPIYLNRAEMAAQWILNHAFHPCGGVLTRLYLSDKYKVNLYDFDSENIFAFDTGMVLYGMICLYAKTKNNEYLYASEVMAKFLIEKMQNQDGSLSAIYDAKNDKVINTYEKWSSQAGGFLAKVSMGLIDVFANTSAGRYRDAAVKLCEFALTTQDTSGRFITDKPTQTTHLHPHSYTAEGLFYTGTAIKNKSFINAAERAVEWSLDHVEEDGINALYDPTEGGSFNSIQRSDILAQTLRLGILLQRGEKLDWLKAKLLFYQYQKDQDKQQGGFYFSLLGCDLNAWCSMFALQAIALSENEKLLFDDERISLLI